MAIPTKRGDDQPPQFKSNPFWDERFNQATYAYGTSPNAFFQQRISRLPAGKLLLPGEGEGRNAVYAAELGWQVTALDFSTAGREKALALAKTREVTIDYRLGDVRQFQTEERYDLIGLIYLHLSPEEIAPTYQRYAQLLQPGGQLLIELFHKNQIGLTTGGPPRLDWLVNPEELAPLFPELTIVHLEAVERDLKEGPFHDGPAWVTQFLGQKP